MVKNILVVDDDSSVRYTVKNGIELYDNYKVTTVESGIKCLDILRNNQIPDLILLDVMMPEMSGWKTFDKIKENEMWRDIPIIFLTARTDRVAKHAGGFLAEDYIEKPTKIPELKERIDKVLNKK
jgi:putative two-component system response regulator